MLDGRDIPLCRICYAHRDEPHIMPMIGICRRIGFWQILTEGLHCWGPHRTEGISHGAEEFDAAVRG